MCDCVLFSFTRLVADYVHVGYQSGRYSAVAVDSDTDAHISPMNSKAERSKPTFQTESKRRTTDSTTATNATTITDANSCL